MEILVELVERADDLADVLMRRVPGKADPNVAAECVLALAAVEAAGTLTSGKRAAVAAWLADRTPPSGN